MIHFPVRALPLLTAAAFLSAFPLSAEPAGEAEPGEKGKKPASTPRDLVDGLDQANLQEAFRLLRSDYIHHDRLDPLEINRAALQGLLERLEFGATLLTGKSRAERDSPFGFHAEAISPRVAALRFGRYDNADVKKLDEALGKFTADGNIGTLIVDLRSPQRQADFAIAAEILGRFRPPNELLFKIRRPGNERATLFISKRHGQRWTRDLILLVDGESGNVAEIIAAVLKRETDCLVIGEPTPGLTVEYRDVPVGEDRYLRYAIAEVVLEDGSSLFQKGIEPDILTVTPQKTKHAIYRASDNGKNLSEFLFLKTRPRLNEAALVAGTDPELDYYLLRSNNQPTPWDKPALEDRVLRQAVDLLTTREFLDGER